MASTGSAKGNAYAAYYDHWSQYRRMEDGYVGGMMVRMASIFPHHGMSLNTKAWQHQNNSSSPSIN
jgi:hypothetical protein